MTPDLFDELLEECVQSTGVERYRHLASAANTLPAPHSAEDYRRWILERGWRRRLPVDYAPAIGGGGSCAGCGGSAMVGH